MITLANMDNFKADTKTASSIYIAESGYAIFKGHINGVPCILESFVDCEYPFYFIVFRGVQSRAKGLNDMELLNNYKKHIFQLEGDKGVHYIANSKEYNDLIHTYF